MTESRVTPENVSEPSPTERFRMLHNYYTHAISEGRNDGVAIMDSFFPKDPEEFTRRASEVTAEDIFAFSKAMNERWTAARLDPSRIARVQNRYQA